MPDETIIVQVDPDLEDLIPGFLENRKSDLEKLRVDLDKNDFDSVNSIGHSIKGVGGGYGFALMSELGANIEAAGKAKNAEAALENINRLDDYLRCIKVEFA
jgi:HPt (histidine-containing phosphotransfer) domain-containing protein